MKELCIVIIGLIAVYLVGRILMKAGLHEFDSYLNKKFNNHTKIKKDGKEEEK